MPFTTHEVENIATAMLDFHMAQGNVKSQSLQNKPLLRRMRANMKTFPGGKEYITRRVKGVYTTSIQGFEHNDQVTYSNPANLREVKYPWKLIHAGIEFTMHELLKGGISIVDTANGKGETRHSEREKMVLVDLLKDKLEDMTEGYDRGMNLMYWRDGTSDSSLIPGLRSFIVNSPSSATVVGGLDQAANSWWRNRASLSIDASTASNLNITNKLQVEFRQLRRYEGGSPTCAFLGSDFLEAWEKELRSKGNFTEVGWSKGGKIDPSVADITFKGVDFEYDPTLDDEGLAKYCFVIDEKNIYPMAIEGEDGKKHNPARPHDQYVFHRAVTHAGGMVCQMRRSSGVYSIA